RWAAEQAKKKLSDEVYATVREESLAVVDGKPLHLEVEIDRQSYQDMIRPLVETTLESVSAAMADAGKTPDDIDEVLLVGGSTRTPLIRQVLTERMRREPRQDVHPDLCVALGAGVLASRLSGHDVQRVLVDVSPYSFGPSYLGERDGRTYRHCYHPVIHRNTPLPVTRTDQYVTSYPYQEEVDIDVFQGDDPDAMKNILVGHFRVKGLTPTVEPNEVLCRMNLDIDGILRVTAIEKRTGLSRHITISNALKSKSDEEIAASRQRLNDLYGARAGFDQAEADSEYIDVEAEPEPLAESDPRIAQARELVERSRGLLGDVHDEDREEIIDLHEEITQAMREGDMDGMTEAVDRLRELLFFIEGK
ncbi:MAG: Hsp70 family protein, partial [Verrucomicrobiaceae bacterium]|nr:Hsp70 family protein [Verrucomicrobiaceae bacterium]